MYNVHSHLQHLPLEEIQQIAMADRLPYGIMLFNFSHDLNIGNCIRSAHLLGAESVTIFGRNKIDSRSCVGAHNYLKFIRVNAVEDNQEDVVTKFDKLMADEGMYPVFFDLTEKSQDIRKMTITPGLKPCLVFGNEADGIPDYLLSKGPHFHINQKGVIRSFNVASAASMVMYHVMNMLDGPVQ